MTLKADSDHPRPSSSDQQPMETLPPTGSSRSRQRSGPKTPAGKKRVSGNAVTHGLSSTRLIVPGERSADWGTHRLTTMEALAPVGAVETALAERVASAVWRLRRVTAYETAAIDERLHLEQASARLLPHPADIDKIIRYEAHLSRQLYQALHELEAMRAARAGQSTPLVRMDVNNETSALAAAEGA